MLGYLSTLPIGGKPMLLQLGYLPKPKYGMLVKIYSVCVFFAVYNYSIIKNIIKIKKQN